MIFHPYQKYTCTKSINYYMLKLEKQVGKYLLIKCHKMDGMG